MSEQLATDAPSTGGPWIDPALGPAAAAIQSSYIPWIGYFDIIAAVDTFVLMDDVQYTRRDWRNRNRIRSANGGSQWLTIPVQVKGKYTQCIDETLVSDSAWASKHWQTLQHTYRTAPHFADYADQFERAYERAADMERLSDINRLFIDLCCELLCIDTPLHWSTEYETAEGRNERLISLCRALGARQYLSGPSARDYIDLDGFADAEVEVRWADYSQYPEYAQVHEGFDQFVTVLDPLFNLGSGARNLLRSARGVA